MASSSRTQKRPRLSDVEKQYAAILAEKEILPTKFFHETTLQLLGIHRVTEAMMSHAGLESFLYYSARTHARLTVEFLCTFRFWPENGILEGIEYSYAGKKYTMTGAQVRECFGITAEPSPNWDPAHVADNPGIWWGTITGCRHGEDDAYNYQIPHPSLRLAHKVLSMCFFGQGEVNKAPLQDLAFLWALAPECPMVPDWAGLFMKRCHNVRRRKGGKISMGGMITMLVQSMVNIDHLGAEDSEDPPISGGYEYEMQWLLQNRHLIQIQGGGYLWPYGPKDADHFIRLPQNLEYGPSHTFLLPPCDLTGVVALNTASQRRIAKAQRRAQAAGGGQADQRQAVGGEPTDMQIVVSSSSGAQQDHDWQERLWYELGHINASVGALSQRMERLETQVGRVDEHMTAVQEEQARFHQYVETRFNYFTGQWEQFYSRYPPPPDQ